MHAICKTTSEKQSKVIVKVLSKRWANMKFSTTKNADGNIVINVTAKYIYPITEQAKNQIENDAHIVIMTMQAL